MHLTFPMMVIGGASQLKIQEQEQNSTHTERKPACLVLVVHLSRVAIR